MNRLPLSWCRRQINSPNYNIVNLRLSGLCWISTAEIPDGCTNQEFFNDVAVKFPRFVIRGVSQGSAAHLEQIGADILRTGAEAVVDLNNPKGLKRSVIDLARRGGRSGSVLEIPYSEFNAHKVSKLAFESAHAQEPGLTNLYREGFDTNTRCFVLSTSQSQWLGAITISFQDEHYAHTESILRRKNAPVGVMETLFVYVISKLRYEGFTHLSLGEVPFVRSGMEELHSERKDSYFEKFFISSKHMLKYSFNYKGLYQFKNKFNPEWKPVYLVARPGISWMLLLDLYIQSRLIDLSLFKLTSSFRKYSPKLLKTG